MDNEILFSERQKFKQWWVWIILICINGLFSYGVFKQVIGGQQFGEQPMSNAGLLIATLLMLVLTILFITCKLDMQIKKDGIYIKFFPFHLSFKKFTWNQLTKVFVREYNPIGEYGGWGLRLGLFGKGKAFTVSGNKGLQLEFLNNKKLLIGTNKPDQLEEVLNKIQQLKQ